MINANTPPVFPARGLRACSSRHPACMKQLIVFLFFAMVSSSCINQNAMIDKSLVKDFEIDKYLGQWYEIARFDHRFERGLERVSANYAWREDGKIRVVNRGYNEESGQMSEATGKAKIPDPGRPSRLKVSFFWIFYSDYLILELDKDYRWAIIGSSSDKYLWILAREPHMDDTLYRALLDKAGRRGYDVSKLIRVKQ